MVCKSAQILVIKKSRFFVTSEPSVALVCHQILANTTPIGMVGKDSSSGDLPISRENIRGFEVVFDAVYNPPETPLLQEAKRYIAAAQSLKRESH